MSKKRLDWAEKNDVGLQAAFNQGGVSGEALSAAGLTSSGDIVALVPNANLTNNPRGFDTYISIRGMTQSDSNAEPNFGAYRNGIFNGGHRVNLGPQLDVERVEVLRGPQGGLYGREAVGGAINIVYAMPRPGDELNGYATLDFGNVSRTRVEGAVTLPVGDKVAVRATGWYIDQGEGDYRNITLQEWVDRKDDQGGRLSLVAELAPSLKLETTVEYGERPFSIGALNTSPRATNSARSPFGLKSKSSMNFSTE